jgi:hypothetical protein
VPAATQLPLTEDLHKLFEYRDGAIYWKIMRSGMAKAGSQAGCVNGRGYFVVGINLKKYFVHRIIWAMHGNEPVVMLDHINGDTADNRIENLRAATYESNNCNARLSKRNTSGYKGVSWNSAVKKWMGTVQHEHKIYKTPAFDCRHKCAEAVKALRCELHGEFTRHA